VSVCESCHLALLKASWVGILGTFPHAEVDTDVEPVGLSYCNEWSS